HAHKGRARTLALLAGLMGGRTLLVLNRGVSFPVAGVRRVGYTTRRVHAIVAVCESIKRGLVAGGVSAEKIEVIYSGTDLERFHPGVDGAPIRRELSLGRDDLLVTQVGVRPWRGWKELMAAMRTVDARRPRARGGALLAARQARRDAGALPPARGHARRRMIAGAVGIYRRVFVYLEPYLPLLIVGGTLALVVAAMEGAIAWLVKPAMEDI